MTKIRLNSEIHELEISYWDDKQQRIIDITDEIIGNAGDWDMVSNDENGVSWQADDGDIEIFAEWLIEEPVSIDHFDVYLDNQCLHTRTKFGSKVRLANRTFAESLTQIYGLAIEEDVCELFEKLPLNEKSFTFSPIRKAEYALENDTLCFNVKDFEYVKTE